MTTYTKGDVFEVNRSAELTSAHIAGSGLAIVCLFSCVGLVATTLLYLLGFGAELTWGLAAG